MINRYAVIYLAANVVPAMVGFLALTLYTHLLSPNEYGIYVVGAGIAGVISAVFFSWLRLSVSRYQGRSADVDLRAEAIVAYGGMVIVIAALTPAAIFVMRPSIGFGIIVGSILLSVSLTAFEISQEFRRARLNPLRFTTIAVTRSILGLTLGFVAIKLGGGGLGLLLAVGASFLVTTVWSVRNSIGEPPDLSSVGHLRQFIRYGLPFTISALAYALHGTVDRLSVAYLLGQSAAGCYGPAADMTRQVIGMFAGSTVSVMFPLAFRSLAQSGTAAARKCLKEGIELLLALIAPVTVWLAMAADVISGSLLGPEFQVSVAAILPLLALGRMFGSVNQNYLQISFQLAERPFLQVAHDVSILALNLALLFPLTLAFGLVGTAAAIAIAEGLGIITGVLLSRLAFRLPLNGWGVVRVFASTALVGLVTYATKTVSSGHGLVDLVNLAASGCVAYAAAVMLFDLAGLRAMLVSLLRPRAVPAE